MTNKDFFLFFFLNIFRDDTPVKPFHKVIFQYYLTNEETTIKESAES